MKQCLKQLNSVELPVSNVKCYAYESFFTFINTHPKCSKYKTRITQFFTDKHNTLFYNRGHKQTNEMHMKLISRAVNKCRGKFRAQQQGLNLFFKKPLLYKSRFINCRKNLLLFESKHLNDRSVHNKQIFKYCTSFKS